MDMIPERKLWLSVATQAIDDAARKVEAARRRQRYLWIDGCNHAIRSDEADHQRAYFEGSHWHMVAALAGLDADADQIMRLVMEPNLWRRRLKMAGTEWLRRGERGATRPQGGSRLPAGAKAANAAPAARKSTTGRMAGCERQ